MGKPRASAKGSPQKRPLNKASLALRQPSRRDSAFRWWEAHPAACFLFVSMLWVALLYAKAINEPFIYDDVLAIQQNPALSSWHDVLRYFRAPVELNDQFRGYAGSIYRPLVWLGFVLNHKLSGSSPAGFHFTNLVLHWANGSIGFFLLRTLGVSPLTAAASCLIWLGLPINSEAVAWISGRHTCQATFFILISLLLALGYAQKRRPILLLGYAAAVLCALFSNEWGVLALPLTALIIYIDGLKDRRTWLNLSLSGVGVFALELVMRRSAGARLPAGSLQIMPVGLSFFKYLSWIILPIHMSVERSTDTPTKEITFNSIAALVGLGCFLFIAFKLRGGAPRVAAGLTWTLICLVPFCGVIFIYQGMAERYAYLASAGLVFALAALADYLKSGMRLVLLSVLSLWVLWGAWRLNARVLEWSNETTLFQSSLKVNPRSEVLLYNLGIASAAVGNVQEATSYYQRALEANPNDLNLLVNYGDLLRDQENYAAALALQERAIRVAPKNAELWVNLGDTYLKQGSAEKAVDAFTKAASLDAHSIEAAVGLGAAFQSTGKLSAARQQYQRAIVIDPHQGAAYCNLGALLLKEGDAIGAIEQFKKAIAADASYFPAYFDLGLIYESSGRNAQAIAMFEKALQLKPDDANAVMHLRRLQAR